MSKSVETAATAGDAVESCAKAWEAKAAQPIEQLANVAQAPATRALAQQWLTLAARPDLMAETALRLWRDYGEITADYLRRSCGGEAPTAAATDRSFADAAWQEAPFAALREAYEATARAVVEVSEQDAGLDEAGARKVRFFTRQALAALNPANFPLLNPVVLREAWESRGATLLRGMSNLFRDVNADSGQLRFTMSDEAAWEVGRNLASTPGKVVYQNDLMQLIQYAPSTTRVARRPLLVIPPWLNKYYILDLQPDNSMVRWLVAQGHTVFLISWVNPDRSHAGKEFEDYMLEGPIAALDAIERATGEREVNAVGYCLGGILLACTAAWLTARGDRRLRSITLLTALLEYSEVGEIRAFVDEDELAALERTAGERGYIPGGGVAWAFRMLRPSDLIWSFWVDYYLRGKERKPFDLLYWNADATNMPARAHLYFMRQMYIHDRLREPGGITLAGTPIDLARIKVPAYVVGTREDHIAPWRATWRSAQLLGGRTRFVLGESGHIAGIVNAPAKGKYAYHVAARAAADAEQWLAATQAHAGSWWPDWQRWLSRHSGGTVAARAAGSRRLPAIEDAPGSYVQRRLPASA